MSVPDDFIRGDGPHLVEASAGTGKTYWMVKTAVDLLLHAPQLPRVGNPERLLAMTFTRAATAELKERLRKALQDRRAAEGGAEDPRLLEVLQSLDKLAVTTIHGFCMGVLEEFALECGVPAGLRFLEDIGDYVDAAVADEWRALTWAESPESAIVVEALVAGDTDRWSPEALRKAALKVRGAIGATRPDRLPDRAQLATRRETARAALVGAFDEARLQRFAATVTWNSETLGDGDVAALGHAVARMRAGQPVMVEHVARWTRAAVEKLASKKSKAIKAHNEPLLRDEPMLDAAAAFMEAELGNGELLWQDAVLGVVDRLEASLRQDRVAGFDDMIAMVSRALDGEHGAQLRKKLSDRYDAVLVDEFQDTDWAQWQIFAQAFGDKPLILVGDPKQSIYGFRGADITAYYAAKKAAAGRTYTQDVNYRSDAGLVAATNLLFKATQPFGVDPTVLGFHDVSADQQEPRLLGDPGGRPLTLVELGANVVPRHTRRIAAYIAQEVVRLLSAPAIQYAEKDKPQRRLQPRDIAILVNANYQAQPILEALRAAGVAAVSGTTGDITECETWRDLMAVLVAVDDPADDRAVRRALVTALAGRSAAELYALVRDEPAWRRQVDLLVEARREWVRRGVLTALTRLLATAEWDSVARLARRTDAERRLTDLRHIIGLMQQAEREGHRSPTQMRAWAKRFAERASEQGDARQQHLESDRQAVLISTVHGAKGLEWPVVFCPFLWRAPKERQELAQVVRRAGDERRHVRLVSTPFKDEEAPDPALSEQLRLAYVALTRAKCRTYVVNAQLSRPPKVPAPLHHLLSHYGDRAVEQLSAASPHVLAVHPPPALSIPRLSQDTHEADALAAASRPVTAAQARSWSVSSYTQLTRHVAHGPAGAHGAQVVATAFADESGPVDDAEVAMQDAGDALRADQLPGGPHVGNALHWLFEQLDFTRVDDAPYRDALIADVLEAYALPRPGADATARAAAGELMTRMLATTLSVPMPSATLPLRAVPLRETLREWRFHLPMQGLRASALAAAFRQHGAGWLAEDYAPLLERVSGRTLDGFLVGVVDLVAQLDGRWWIVDWKSNTLGPAAEDYDAEGCRHEMMRTHYVLQYHLYVVALHRFLRVRVPGYSYARDFGGVGYAFLRGLAMGEPAWFTDRPSPALVDALDAAVGGGQP